MANHKKKYPRHEAYLKVKMSIPELAIFKRVAKESGMSQTDFILSLAGIMVCECGKECNPDIGQCLGCFDK